MGSKLPFEWLSFAESSMGAPIVNKLTPEVIDWWRMPFCSIYIPHSRPFDISHLISTWRRDEPPFQANDERVTRKRRNRFALSRWDGFCCVGARPCGEPINHIASILPRKTGQGEGIKETKREVDKTWHA